MILVAVFPPLAEDLGSLVRFLASQAEEVDRNAQWPGAQLRRLAAAGILRWYAPPDWNGIEFSPSAVLAALSQLASGCLSTTFCLTQPAGVVGRVAASDNDDLKRRIIPELLSGEKFASVGIAQLTTSRRHVRPVMRAREVGGRYVLDGVIPWVTGGAKADYIVTGAVFDDGKQLLGVLPTDRPGVVVEPAAEMVGLTSTSTGPVRCEEVTLEPEWLLAPVLENVLKHGKGAGTGGLQTSALALGTATAAIDYLKQEADARIELRLPTAELAEQCAALAADLAAAADGVVGGVSSDDIRHRANGLALRSAQAALAAAKGSGYVVGHPAGRWCREALFFLVWSCPAPVQSATLCELAKL